MAFATETYDPSQVTVKYAGRTIVGYADGSMVKAVRNADNWVLKVGAQGDTARARNLDRSGTVEVSLLQTSSSNDELAALALADDIGPDKLAALGITSLPLQITDASGTVLVLAPQAWVKKLPDVERGAEVGTVLWVFETGRFETFNALGGAKSLLTQAKTALANLVGYNG